MPITLEKLFSLTVSVTFPFMGEDVTVVFSPARYTGEMQDWTERMLRDNEAVIGAIEEGREMVRTTEDRLAIEAAKPEPNPAVIADLSAQIAQARSEADAQEIHLTHDGKSFIRESLSKLLVSWDVMDGKKPLATDLDTLNKLPDFFLFAVWSAMQGENQPDPQNAPDSDGPSSTEGTSAPSPTGTTSSRGRGRSASRPSTSTNGLTVPVTIQPGAPGH